MKYFKIYKETGAEAEEITKAEAKRTLEGWWKQEALDDIFDNEKAFHLWTAFAEVWTKDADGCVPMAGFIGVCE